MRVAASSAWNNSGRRGGSPIAQTGGVGSPGFLGGSTEVNEMVAPSIR